MSEKAASARALSDLARAIPQPVILVVMGVSGSGKSTIATLLATALACPYQEGDDLHPHANIEKMHAGTPLTDADRAPWLRRIAETVDGWRAAGCSGVLSCSALKRSYRDVIIGNRAGVRLVYLRGSRDLIDKRLRGRRGHFMPAALLESQFAALEEPTADEHPIAVSIEGSPEEIAADVLGKLAG